MRRSFSSSIDALTPSLGFFVNHNKNFHFLNFCKLLTILTKRSLPVRCLKIFAAKWKYSRHPQSDLLVIRRRLIQISMI